jgi:Family of unknown function (DUF5681)
MAKMNKKDTPTDYSVGRGKPPAHSRFKPGQSGNPGGRKRGTPNMKTVLEEVLLAEIEMRENGRKRTVSLLEALIKRSVQEGLNGDLRAIKDLLDRYERHSGYELETEAELPEDDQAIVKRALLMCNSTTARIPGHRRGKAEPPDDEHPGGSEWGERHE